MGFPFPIKTWIQKNKHYFITILEGMREENFFSVDKVVRDYDLLNEKVVYGLWRMISFSIWYQFYFKKSDFPVIT